MDRKLLFLQLNEFNVSLLKTAANELRLDNLKRLLTLYNAETFTNDVRESEFLEPWSQWVSVHTGQPSSEHRIQHLGDAPNLNFPQMWEILSKHKVTSGVWGSMNATRGDSENCSFFFPDPWTYGEDAYPENLQNLLRLPRYTSKNYLTLSKREMFKGILSFFKGLYRERALGSVFSLLPSLVKNALRFRGKHFVFIVFLDYLCLRLFLLQKKKFKPQFSVLFLNCIAHLQHHRWIDPANPLADAGLAFGFSTLDRMMGELFAALEAEEELIVASALSQKNNADETPWWGHQPKVHADFVKACGIENATVEPMMTYDAHVLLKSPEEARRAFDILSKVSVNGKKFLLVKQYEDIPTKLFYRVDYSEERKEDDILEINGKAIPFADLIFTYPYAQRARHIPQGTVLTTLKGFPKKLMNHHIYDNVLQFFGVSAEQVPHSSLG